MRKKLEFTVYGAPVAQPRQRFGAFNGNVRPYGQKADAAITVWRAAVRDAAVKARDAANLPVFTGPLELSILMLVPRVGKVIWKKDPMPRLWVPSKPDLDNTVKGIKDSLSPKKGGIGIWKDDKLVVRYGFIEKMYCAAFWETVPGQKERIYHEEPARALVRIEEIIPSLFQSWEERVDFRGVQYGGPVFPDGSFAPPKKAEAGL